MNILGSLTSVISIMIFILASVFALFLYFRNGRHELVDDEFLFDSAIIGFIGALFGGRLIDFVLRPDFYDMSLSKLFFFNVYEGFDWYGAILGALIAIYLYTRKKRVNAWFILDLLALPLIFATIVISLGNFLLYSGNLALFYVFGLSLIFWVLKRLARIKRHDGFLFSLTLVLVSVLNLSLFRLAGSKYLIYQQVEYGLVLPALVLVIGLILLYMLSQRKLNEDIKNLGASLLLGILKLKRVFSSLSETNIAAKFIILLPLYISKFVLDLVKLLGREIQLSLIELAQVFGIKR